MINIEDIKSAREWMMDDCNLWFDELALALQDDFVVIKSNNPKDNSRYLIPKGTEDQITLYGKPDNSFRVSDHWNWRANMKKCKAKSYVQCYTRDMPWTAKRADQWRSTKPMFGCAVMYYSPVDHQYHAIYGEKFNRKTKAWSFLIPEVQVAVDIAKNPSQFVSNRDNTEENKDFIKPHIPTINHAMISEAINKYKEHVV